MQLNLTTKKNKIISIDFQVHLFHKNEAFLSKMLLIM